MRIGLALGGGGARGLAHIPMLEAFDELGLKPAVIAGCSMGALVGSMYAGGMSGKEIRAHAEKLLSNRIDFAKYVFGSRKTKLTELLSIKSLSALHLSGEKLADLALPDFLPKNIEDTPIPLKLIATDFELMEEVVLTSGSMITGVGASIAIPGLITAPKINGRVHVDGGIVNPVPFDRVREGMDIVVAIDVTGKPKPIGNAHASNMDMAIGSLLIMFNQLAESRRALSPPDIYIKPNVDQFGAGDFFRVRALLDAAVPAKDQLKRLVDKQVNATLIGGM
jgi:NTE family protein